MSVPVLRSCSRLLSPKVGKHISSVGQAVQMSSTSKPKDSKPKAPKSKTSTSATNAKAPSESAPPGVVEAGDKYKAGEEFFSYNSYSFYDIENDMKANRLPQPSSEKMEIICLEKLNRDTTIDKPPGVRSAPQQKAGDVAKNTDKRRLLPDDFGYMVDWPNHDYEGHEDHEDDEPKYKINPADPANPRVEDKETRKLWDQKKDPFFKARLPL